MSTPLTLAKAALRESGAWLDALVLPGDAAPVCPYGQCGVPGDDAHESCAAFARLDAAGPLPPNAAERWDASLPGAAELAIAAERARRSVRPSAALAAYEARREADECAEHAAQAELDATARRRNLAHSALAFAVVVLVSLAIAGLGR